MRLDSSLLDDIGSVVEDGLSNLMGMAMTGNKAGGQPPAEVIDDNPRQYADLNLDAPPAVKLPEGQPEPLLVAPPSPWTSPPSNPMPRGNSNCGWPPRWACPTTATGASTVSVSYR